MVLTYAGRTKQEHDVALALGYASLRWQYVERQMLVVLANALGIEQRTANEMFAKIQTFALKLELLEIVVIPKMVDDEWRAKWREICAFIRELSGDRNYLMHNSMAFEVQADLVTTIPKIGFTNAKRTAYDHLEIRELEHDFHHAYIDLLLIDSCVRNGQSSADKHREMNVRRRPSRTERLEARKRKPPRQRKRSRDATEG